MCRSAKRFHREQQVSDTLVLLDKHGVDINCTKYSGEDFADLGGLLALKKTINRSALQIVTLPQPLTRKNLIEELAPLLGLRS